MRPQELSMKIARGMRLNMPLVLKWNCIVKIQYMHLNILIYLHISSF